MSEYITLSPAQGQAVLIQNIVDDLYQVVQVHRVVGVMNGDTVRNTNRGWVVTRMGRSGPVFVFPHRPTQVENADSNWNYLTGQREEE